jgi:hypothetical protein
MSQKSLSYLSDEATQRTNVAGTTTEILEVDPDQGTLTKLLNRVSTGDAPGLPVFMDLNDAGDNDLPADTELILRVLRPTDDEPVAVSVKEDNIAAWNGLSVSQQRNEENIDQVKIELKGDINVRDKDTLFVEVDSSAQIDWSNSELYFAREGVHETEFSG